MRYRITHRTEYRYDAEVSASHNEAHLVPRPLPNQRCLEALLEITPMPSERRDELDAFGNVISRFSIEQPHTTLTVLATSTVEVRPRRTVPAGSGPPWHVVAEVPGTDPAGAVHGPADGGAGALRALVLDSTLAPASPTAREYASPSFTGDTPISTAVIDLCTRIHDDFRYRPGSTSVATGLDEVFERREGVCQDFTHVAIACLRSMGVPARYVSGYIETDPPPVGEKLKGSDSSHAWLSVFVPGEGWLDVDPTNGRVPDDRYIVTAWGRDYADVAPITGVIYSVAGHQELSVFVDVERLEPSTLGGDGQTARYGQR